MNEGGLDYKIIVGGDWKAELSAFEDRINKLKADAAKLATASVKTPKQSPTVSRSPEIKAEQALSDIEKKRISLQRQARVIQDEGVQADLQSLKIARQSAQYSDIQSNARMRNAKAAEELKIKEAQINQLMRDQGITARKAAEQVGLTSAQAKQLKLNMWDAEHAARQFLFTFRRLVGILAVFTLARKFAQALASGVGEMIRFNSEIETTQNSISTIISSVGRIYDAQGNLLSGQEAFNTAAQQSEAIVNELKKAAVGSVATFESLTKAFQVAVGPGLAAGLDVKQITTVTKRLVEGAVAMKVPLDQMSEEIRSILQGTATSKNTRLVSLFGGSAAEVNEQIRQAKEQGRLYTFLTQKLEGVGFGALNAASSFEVLKSDLKDTGSLLAAKGGIALFNELKETLLGLRNALVQSDAQQGFIFKPEALGIVQELGNSLAVIIRSFREVGDSQQTLGLLKDILANIADALAVVAPLAVGVFQGLVNGVGAVLTPIRILADTLRMAFDIKDGVGIVASLLKHLTSIAVVSFVISKIWKAGAMVRAMLLGLGIAQRTLLAMVAQAGAAVDINKNLTITSALAAIIQQRMTGVAVRTAFATAGISVLVTVLLAALSFLISKTQTWKNLMEKLNPSIKDTASEVDAMGGSVRGALQDIGDIDSEFKNAADDAKKLRQEIELMKALEGVKGAAKDILSLYIQRQQAIDKVTTSEQEGIKASREQLSLLEQQRAELLSKNRTQLAAGKGSVGEAVFKASELSKKEAEVLQRITQLEDDRKEKARQVVALYDEKIKKAIEEQRIEREKTLPVSLLETQGAYNEALAEAKGIEYASLEAAKTKLAVINEQASQQDKETKKAIELYAKQLDGEEALLNAIGNTDESRKKLQETLDSLKAPDVTPLIREQELKERVEKARKALQEAEAGFRPSAGLFNRVASAASYELQAAEKELQTLQASGASDRAASSQLEFTTRKKALQNEINEIEDQSKAKIAAEDRIKQIWVEITKVQEDGSLESQKQNADKIKALRELAKAEADVIYNISRTATVQLEEAAARLEGKAQKAAANKSLAEAASFGLPNYARDVVSIREQQKVVQAETLANVASFKAAQAETQAQIAREIATGNEQRVAELKLKLAENQAAQETALLSKNTEMLKNQQDLYVASLKASAKFVDGVKLGLLDFIQQAPGIGESIGAAVKDSLDGVASAFGAAFREYLTTGQDVRAFFLNALGDVFLNIAEQFATNVAKNLLANMAGETIGKFLMPAASNAPLIASNTALVASINANTAAMGGALPAALAANAAATTGDAAATTANTSSLWTNTGAVFSNIGALLTNTAAIFTNLFALTLNTAATLMNTVATVLNTAMQALAGIIGSAATATAIAIQTAIQGALLLAIIGLLGMANFWLAGIFLNTLAGLFFKKGGLVPGGMADGGKVKGYAHGGKIGGFARPSNIPASDTVPAWLTPGEYVLPVNLVDKLGVGFLDALRSGVVSPSSFRDAGSSLMASSSAVRGFATGGAVSPVSSSNTSGNRPVNVAFFDDRKAMRRWAESSEGETAIMKVMQRNSFKFA